MFTTTITSKKNQNKIMKITLQHKTITTNRKRSTCKQTTTKT